MLYNAEDHGQILFIWYLKLAILIPIIMSAYICQTLQEDASLDEVIKCNLHPHLSVKLSNEDVVKLVRVGILRELTLTCSCQSLRLVPVISVEEVLQSVIYFQVPLNLLKFMPALLSQSNIDMTNPAVTGFNGVHVLSDSACWSSLSYISWLLSLSALWKMLHESSVMAVSHLWQGREGRW